MKKQCCYVNAKIRLILPHLCGGNIRAVRAADFA